MELIKYENNIALLDTKTSQKIAEFERQLKVIKQQEDELKQAILGEMESKNIIKLETEDLLINYIASSDRETFDTKTFRAEHEDLYNDYIKLSPVKACIRIKTKEAK